jgi:delta14-sterol reductase
MLLMELSNCRFFFVRAGMMGWLLINLSVLAKSIQDGTLSKSMILFQLFCAVISKTCILSFVDRKTHLFIIIFIFIFLISAHLFQLYILDYFVHEEYMTST